MTYQPKRAWWRIYHRSWRTGYIQNSAVGDREAVKLNRVWTDNDAHLTLPVAGEVPAIVNGHGAPEKFWGTHRFESLPWTYWSKRRVRKDGKTYHLRTIRESFEDAKRFGRKREVEIKDWRPLASDVRLAEVMGRIARHAEAVWGDDWTDHVIVKVVSTIGGGWDSYGSRVLKAAHAAGIPTLVTCRGRDRFRTFKGCTYITWVRSSAVIR